MARGSLLVVLAAFGACPGSQGGGDVRARDRALESTLGWPDRGPGLEAGVGDGPVVNRDQLAWDHGKVLDHGKPVDLGDPDLTPDGCFRWPGLSGLSLQKAVNAHTCVEVQAGTHLLDAPVPVPPGHTLRGLGKKVSILRAKQATWSFNCCDSLVTDTLPANPAQNPFTVRKLGLDGAGVATYNVCCRGYTVEESELVASRCSAIGIAGGGVAVRTSNLLTAAQPTAVPGKGTVTCATGGFGGVAEGAAIYSEGKGTSYGSLIEDNTISGTNGPALDINGAWGGTFRRNTVNGNSAWAAVSLYGASYWTVADNAISHPAGEPPQPYHPYCATGPSGGHAAAIFLCQDTDAGGLTTNENQILRNKSLLLLRDPLRRCRRAQTLLGAPQQQLPGQRRFWIGRGLRR